MRNRRKLLASFAGFSSLMVSACSVSTRAANQPAVMAQPVAAGERQGSVNDDEVVGNAAPAESPEAAAPVAAELAAPAPVPAAQTALAPKQQEVAVLQDQIRRLSEQESASREALQTLKTMMQARAARPQVTYLGPSSTGAFNPPSPAVSTTLSPSEDADTARERAKLQNQVKQLETQLASERQQRQELETQLKKLREETAVSPYSDSIGDELVAARRKITGLEAALASAQRSRDDISEKYDELKKKRNAKGGTPDEDTQAQIAALEQRQRQQLQGLEQELAASQAREQELRQAIAATEKTEGEGEVSYALVSDLRAENAALKAQLKEVHDRNQLLSGKLKAASRVADMLFKSRVSDDDQEY